MALTLQYIIDNRVELLAELNRRQGIVRDYVRGVINLRGTIVPIFDRRARFGEGVTSPPRHHVVVVMSVAAP